MHKHEAIREQKIPFNKWLQKVNLASDTVIGSGEQEGAGLQSKQ